MTAKERIEAITAKTVMKLPERALRRIAGDPIEIDDRTLDVRIQLAAAQAARGPSIAELDPPAARVAAAQAFATTNARRAPGVAVHDMAIAADGHVVAVRVYRPTSAAGLVPAMLFFHQGGFVIGDLDTCDSFCSRVAADLSAVVVSVDYRLAPEHQFPAQSADADAAYAWLRSNGAVLGVDAKRIVVCGDSAGGQMTAALCQRLRDAGDPQPALQVLVYPYVDATADDGSMVSCAETFPLDTTIMDFFVSHYLPDGFDPADPALSPARASGVGDVAPAVVVTAGFDPLRDQGIAFASALRAAGVDVTERCEDSLSHSFLALDGLIPAASAATDRLIADIGHHV